MGNRTQHSSIRAKQRGIPPLIIDLLLEFGARVHDGKGAEVCYFDHRSKKRLQSYAGGLLGKLSGELDAYAVVSGDKIVTVGTRFKHINHV